MPPHCDAMDGPVVAAARRALDEHDVLMVLPYVDETGEEEVRQAFDLAVKARGQGPEAGEVADRYFFETVVRIHRAGEGASFTGLKPAGLDVGPVIPLAEEAIAEGRPDTLVAFLTGEVERETRARFEAMAAAGRLVGTGVKEARAYVGAMLGLQVWSHRLYGAIHAAAHEHGQGAAGRDEHARSDAA